MAEGNVDIEMLQQTCLRQSTEIDQLKDMMSKLLLEAEGDRRKLRQRNKDIEELMKNQQTLAMSGSLTSGLDVSASIAHHRNGNSRSMARFNRLGGSGIQGDSLSSTMVSSVSAPSVNSFSLSGDKFSVDILDQDDIYETNLPYAN
ncbi:hypothetical protein BGZ65_000196, partial [Modicella reniformis]